MRPAGAARPAAAATATSASGCCRKRYPPAARRGGKGRPTPPSGTAQPSPTIVVAASPTGIDPAYARARSRQRLATARTLELGERVVVLLDVENGRDRTDREAVIRWQARMAEERAITQRPRPASSPKRCQRQRRHVIPTRALEIELGARAVARLRVENRGRPSLRERWIVSNARQLSRYVSHQCQLPNRHGACADDDCHCICHPLALGRKPVGWLRAEMHATIAELAEYVGPADERQRAYWAAATVLAVWQCGPDHVRIQHALEKQPTLIFEAARRLREAGIWEPGGIIHAPYMEPGGDDGAELLHLTLHVLVAEGKVAAHRVGDTFEYSAVD